MRQQVCILALPGSKLQALAMGFLTDLSEQIPHEECVALSPARFPREYRLSVRFIQGKLAAEVADVRVVCLFEVEIAQRELFAIHTALALERIPVEPLSVHGPQPPRHQPPLKPR